MAARVNARTKPPAVVAPEEVDDVPEFSTTPVKPDPKAKKIPLFRVDGKTWEMEARYDFGAAIAYLHGIRNGTQRNAEFALIEHLVGGEGLAALVRATDNNPDKWEAVMRRAMKPLIGATEAEEDPGN